MQQKTARQINFIDLKAQQKKIRANIDARVAKVLDHGAYILGPEVSEVEQRLVQYVGMKHCVTCGNGTDALLMALMAYDVRPGDAIFVPSFTFVATAEVVALAGATPIFLEIDERTYNVDPSRLEETIVEFKRKNAGLRPRGIIPVDLFGQPADYDSIASIAKRHGLFVLEDAAQGFGGAYKGKKTCVFGDIAATSFFPAKPLGCYGDGGAIFTNDDTVKEKLLSIRVHGQGKDKYDNVRIGINGRMDTIQAAVLLAKMDVFDDELKARQRIAARYTHLLGNTVATPYVRPDCTSCWAQYSVLTDNRDSVLAGLKSRNVPAAIYYPKPLHLQEAFGSLGYKRGDFPVTERIAGKIFSIPMHPYLDETTQDYIVASIKESV